MSLDRVKLTFILGAVEEDASVLRMERIPPNKEKTNDEDVIKKQESTTTDRYDRIEPPIRFLNAVVGGSSIAILNNNRNSFLSELALTPVND